MIFCRFQCNHLEREPQRRDRVNFGCGGIASDRPVVHHKLILSMTPAAAWVYVNQSTMLPIIVVPSVSG